MNKKIANFLQSITDSTREQCQWTIYFINKIRLNLEAKKQDLTDYMEDIAKGWEEFFRLLENSRIPMPSFDPNSSTIELTGWLGFFVKTAAQQFKLNVKQVKRLHEKVSEFLQAQNPRSFAEKAIDDVQEMHVKLLNKIKDECSSCSLDHELPVKLKNFPETCQLREDEWNRYYAHSKKWVGEGLPQENSRLKSNDLIVGALSKLVLESAREALLYDQYAKLDAKLENQSFPSSPTGESSCQVAQLLEVLEALEALEALDVYSSIPTGYNTLMATDRVKEEEVNHSFRQTF